MAPRQPRTRLVRSPNPLRERLTTMPAAVPPRRPTTSQVTNSPDVNGMFFPQLSKSNVAGSNSAICSCFARRDDDRLHGTSFEGRTPTPPQEARTILGCVKPMDSLRSALRTHRIARLRPQTPRSDLAPRPPSSQCPANRRFRTSAIEASGRGRRCCTAVWSVPARGAARRSSRRMRLEERRTPWIATQPMAPTLQGVDADFPVRKICWIFAYSKLVSW
jgi:hypothetical protein